MCPAVLATSSPQDHTTVANMQERRRFEAIYSEFAGDKKGASADAGTDASVRTLRQRSVLR